MKKSKSKSRNGQYLPDVARGKDMRYFEPLIFFPATEEDRDSLRWRLPELRKVPAGRVLVHNHIAHTKDMPIGLHGFRCWTQKPESKLVRCKCGWAGIEHYHVKGPGGHKSFTEAEYEKTFGEPLYGRRVVN
jgi:hypothetical protein